MCVGVWDVCGGGCVCVCVIDAEVVRTVWGAWWVGIQEMCFFLGGGMGVGWDLGMVLLFKTPWFFSPLFNLAYSYCPKRRFMFFHHSPPHSYVSILKFPVSWWLLCLFWDAIRCSPCSFCLCWTCYMTFCLSSSRPKLLCPDMLLPLFVPFG